MNSQKLEGASVRSARLYAITLRATENYMGTAFQGPGLRQGLGRGANRTHRSRVSATPVAFRGVSQAFVTNARLCLPSKESGR